MAKRKSTKRQTTI